MLEEDLEIEKLEMVGQNQCAFAPQMTVFAMSHTNFNSSEEQ